MNRALTGQGEVADPELYENGRLARVPGYVTDIFTERALGFVAQRHAAPFLLMLSHKALHPNITQQADGTVVAIGEGGFTPAPRHKDLYADARPPRRGNYAVPPRPIQSLIAVSETEPVTANPGVPKTNVSETTAPLSSACRRLRFHGNRSRMLMN